MRTLFKVFGGLVLLLVAVIIIAPMVINPNDYREEIQAVVKDKTGRDLSINGLALVLMTLV
jgi:AsmA protein